MHFDRKERRKKTTSIWALSLEVDGDDIRKLIANLTGNARRFAETRDLLGVGGKVFEVVEDEPEPAPEVAAEFYPATANGSSPAEGAEGDPGPDPGSATRAAKRPVRPSSPQSGTVPGGGNGSAKPSSDRAASSPAHEDGIGSSAGPGFNQLRNELQTATRRVGTMKRRSIGEFVEWASGGSFKYGDVGRLTKADVPKLRAATEFMASGVANTTP